MKQAVLITVIFFLSFAGQSQIKDNELTPDELALGWELLFDGETLNG